VLTPGNVGASTFGKTAFYPADGKVDAQPLYLSGVPIAGWGTIDVLYIATEHDSVYAIDPVSGTTLWHASLAGAGETPSDDRGCSQVTPEIGITSTPVIDRSRGPNGAMYVVAMSRDGLGNYYQRLHALDVATGTELFGGPRTVQARFPGTGAGSAGGFAIFEPGQYKNRAEAIQEKLDRLDEAFLYER
jgi:outer membrane protein assembly factor BamB